MISTSGNSFNTSLYSSNVSSSIIKPTFSQSIYSPVEFSTSLFLKKTLFFGLRFKHFIFKLPFIFPKSFLSLSIKLYLYVPYFSNLQTYFELNSKLTL